MTPDNIEALANILQRHGIAMCEVQQADTSIRLRLNLQSQTPIPTPIPTPAATPAHSATEAVAVNALRSPDMGYFTSRHPLQEAPAASPGQRVEKGQVIGYLRAGSVLEEVTATQAATLGQQLVEEGALVGYGTPLFELA